MLEILFPQIPHIFRGKKGGYHDIGIVNIFLRFLCLKKMATSYSLIDITKLGIVDFKAEIE